MPFQDADDHVDEQDEQDAEQQDTDDDDADCLVEREEKQSESSQPSRQDGVHERERTEKKIRRSSPLHVKSQLAVGYDYCGWENVDFFFIPTAPP